MVVREGVTGKSTLCALLIQLIFLDDPYDDCLIYLPNAWSSSEMSISRASSAASRAMLL